MKILILCASVLVLYFRALRYEQCDDDLSVWKRSNPKSDRKEKDPMPVSFWHRRYNEYIGSGYYNDTSSHAIAIGLHIAVVVLSYLVFRNFVPDFTAFLAAFFVALNPINIQSVAGLSGKGYSTTVIFVLLGYLFPPIAAHLWFMSLWAPRMTQRNSPFSLVPFIAYPGWQGIALFTALLPAVYQSKIRTPNLTKAVTSDLERVSPKKFILATKLYGYYFRLCLFPYSMGFLHAKCEGIGLSKKHDEVLYRLDKDFWIGAVIIFVVISNMIFNWTPGMFGLLWFSCNIVMWLHLISMHMNVREHFAYTAAPGMMLFLAFFVMGLPYPVNAIAAVIIATAYIVRHWYVMPSKKNEYWSRLFQMIEQENSCRVWTTEGKSAWDEWNYISAAECYTEALKYCPWDFKANHNLGMMCMALGYVDMAEECFNVARENLYYTHKEEQLKAIEYQKIIVEDARKTGSVNRGLLYGVR